MNNIINTNNSTPNNIITVTNTNIKASERLAQGYADAAQRDMQECASFLAAVQRIYSECQNVRDSINVVLGNDLIAHIEDNDNPHRVTAQQLGVYTISQIDSLLANIANIADLATVAISGDYTDLSNLPTIPTVNDATLTIQKNGVNVDSFSANSSVNKTINITVPQTSQDVGALADSTKYGAGIDLAIDSSTYVITAQLKDQNGDSLGSATVVDLPLESVVVSGAYDSSTNKVVLTLKNNSTIEFSIGDLVSGLQSEINSNNKLNSDLVSDNNATNKFVTTSEKTAWNGKSIVNLADWTVT